MSDPIQAFTKAVEAALGRANRAIYDAVVSRKSGQNIETELLASIQAAAALMLDQVIANYNAEHGFDMADFGGLRGDIKALAAELRGTDVTE